MSENEQQRLPLKFNGHQIVTKVDNYLGYFCKKFCHQELWRISESGHTVSANVARMGQCDLMAKLFLYLAILQQQKFTQEHKIFSKVDL